MLGNHMGKGLARAKPFPVRYPNISET